MQLAFWYFLGMAWRLYALRALLIVPQFHGKEYFFDTHVGPDFFAGKGREVLRRYRTYILAPHAVELALIAMVAARYPGNFLYLIYLLAVAAIVDALRYVYVPWKFAQEAWRYASPKEEAPATTVAVELRARTSHDYRIPAVERSIWGATVLGMAMLFYAASHGHFRAHWIEMFYKPALCTYLLAGIALVQRWLIQTRLTWIPGNRADLITWREEMRLYFLRVFDVLRGFLAGSILLPGVLAVLGPYIGWQWRRWIFQGAVTGFGLVAVIVLLRMCSRFAKATKKAGPGRRIALDPGPPPARTFVGVFCWEHDLPAVAIKSGRWFRINLAEARTYLYAAYISGLALFVVWSKLGT
jgi:hypothetical protein